MARERREQKRRYRKEHCGATKKHNSPSLRSAEHFTRPRQKSERGNSRVVGQLNCSEDATDERTKPRPRDRLAQSDAQRVVQQLQARDLGSRGRRRLHATAASGDAAQARETTGLRQLQGRPDTLAKQILRDRWAVHPGHGLAASETVPMIRKPSTGEPYAGKPPVRFGGRGGQKPSLPLSEGPSRGHWIASSLRSSQ